MKKKFGASAAYPYKKPVPAPEELQGTTPNPALEQQRTTPSPEFAIDNSGKSEPSWKTKKDKKVENVGGSSQPE